MQDQRIDIVSRLQALFWSLKQVVIIIILSLRHLILIRKAVWGGYVRHYEMKR